MSYNGSPKFVAIVIMSSEGSVVYGFLPPEEFEDGVASLMKKKNFYDYVVESIRSKIAA